MPRISRVRWTFRPSGVSEERAADTVIVCDDREQCYCHWSYGSNRVNTPLRMCAPRLHVLAGMTGSCVGLEDLSHTEHSNLLKYHTHTQHAAWWQGRNRKSACSFPACAASQKSSARAGATCIFEPNPKGSRRPGHEAAPCQTCCLPLSSQLDRGGTERSSLQPVPCLPTALRLEGSQKDEGAAVRRPTCTLA